MTQERKRRCAALASEVQEISRKIFRRQRAEFGAHGLSLSQLAVLGHLYESGPSTVADLARAEHMKPQPMGAAVASLEEEGLVARRVDAGDGRCWNVSLTEAGKRVLLSGRANGQTWLSRAIEERLDDGERRRLAETVALLRKVLGE